MYLVTSFEAMCVILGKIFVVMTTGMNTHFSHIVVVCFLHLHKYNFYMEFMGKSRIRYKVNRV